MLVIEDDRYQLQQMAEWSARAGFFVRKAADGIEAFQIFQGEHPDLIVLDYHLPGMHGRELLERIRTHATGADTPVMVITADAARQTKIDLLQRGADDFIRKPVDPEEFGARLKALARKSRLVLNLENVTAQRDKANEDLSARALELERLTIGLVAALERASSLNDTDTGQHIQRVCRYAELLARAAGNDDSYCEKILRYAGLHDVGKVGIADHILKKPGALTDEERDEMKAHTLIGGELLRTAGLPSMATNIAFFHHERWNGSGYPHGLAEEDIPLEARIVAVADVFDALVTRRCYKPSYTVTRAVEILEEAGRDQLDPILVELFVDDIDEVLRILEAHSEWLEEEATWA